MKEYYLKHKYLELGQYAYLNYNQVFEVYELNSQSVEDNYQTQFTEEEINEIESTDFDLTNFERIEVEED